jgi:hypothetical protein
VKLFCYTKKGKFPYIYSLKRFIGICLLLLPPFFISGQVSIGKWTSYLPYSRGQKVAVSGNKVFCSTDGGFFYYNKEDFTVNKFNREDGLSDSDISALASSEDEVLIIAYANGNIDLLEGNVIYNLADIQRKLIPGDKRIYSIHTSGQKAYLATGFGIVLLDVDRREIKETYFIGSLGSQLKINDITTVGDYIYAATDEGIYRASLSNPNLIDYSAWSRLSGFPEYTGAFNTLDRYGDKLVANNEVAGADDKLLWFDGISWSLFPYLQPGNVFHLEQSDYGLIVCSDFSFDLIGSSGEIVRHLVPGSPRHAVADTDNTLWVADVNKGLIRNSDIWEVFPIKPDGPSGRNIVSLAHASGKLLGVAGGTTSSLANLFQNAELYSYTGKAWGGWMTDSVKDLVKVVFHPDNPEQYYAASWGYGVLEFNGTALTKIYNESNSTLRTILPGAYIRCAGLAFDSRNNLWVGNSDVVNPLSVRKNDGTWIGFSIAAYVDAPNMGEIMVTKDDHIWVVLPRGRGLFVYDYNSTLDNKDDDQFRKLSVVDRNNKIITNEIYAIAEDHSGNIWLGTSRGVVVYYNPYRVFTEIDFYAQQIIVPRNDGTNLGDVLLGEEIVTCIAVDGANRKWLGTRNGGVFLVSDDGLEQIHSFNTSNSPLLSNSINSIAIDHKKGEVFFGTNNGIISYTSDATGPDDDFRDVYVYPNPIRETYSGPVVVSGLAENSYVKITDLNGNLVFETRSLGGQALWDGKNFTGERVNTGVYLVFLSNEDGSKTHVTKLLFIR